MGTTKRRGRYYSRLRVPRNLRHALGWEVVKSLGTTRRSEARSRCAQWEGKVHHLFTAASQYAMQPHELQRILAEFRAETLSEWETHRATSGTVSTDELEAITLAYGDELERATNALRYNDLASVTALADELLRKRNAQLDHNSSEFQRFCRDLLKTRIEVFKTELRRWEGDYTDTTPLYTPTVAEPGEQPSVALSQLIADFVKHKEAEKAWSQRTGTMFKSGLALFLEVIGDKSVRSVTKADLRHYQETLHKLPKNMTVRFPGKSAQEVLALDATPLLSPASVEKFLHYVKSLFLFAATQDYIEKNPAEAIRLKRAADVQEQRDAFEDEDLKTIFGGDYAEQRKHRPDRYWIPLIMLHSGARLEEIAQLDVADVKQEAGVWIFDLQEAEDGDKRLKTAGSRRKVPIHSALISLGLLDYVEHTKRAGEAKLWPMLERTANGYGSAVSKWFNKRLRELGITSKKKVLYSTRHTVATRLKMANVQDSRVSELLGHKIEGMTLGRYAKPFDAQALLQVVEKLDFGKVLPFENDSRS